MRKIKQVYKITYPTNKIYIGKDAYGSVNIFSPMREKIRSQQINNVTQTNVKFDTALAKGIYLITISDDENKTTTHKVILTNKK